MCLPKNIDRGEKEKLFSTQVILPASTARATIGGYKTGGLVLIPS
jgi:hypothetical protein